MKLLSSHDCTVLVSMLQESRVTDVNKVKKRHDLDVKVIKYYIKTEVTKKIIFLKHILLLQSHRVLKECPVPGKMTFH